MKHDDCTCSINNKETPLNKLLPQRHQDMLKAVYECMARANDINNEIIAMKQEIYNYLLGELYPLPQCSTCQYSNHTYKRVPCGKCEGWNKYKFHKGHESDLKQLTNGIVKIINKHYENRNKTQHR